MKFLILWYKFRVWLLGQLIDFSILYGPIWLLVWSLDKHYLLHDDDGETTP